MVWRFSRCHRGSHLGYRNRMILAVLNLIDCVGVEWLVSPCGSFCVVFQRKGENRRDRDSRDERGTAKKENKNESEETEEIKTSPSTLTCYKDRRPCPTVNQYQLDAPVTQDTRHLHHTRPPQFWIYVAPMSPIKYRLSQNNGLGGAVIWRSSRWVTWGHLGYQNGMILAILNLHVVPMPPTKFGLNWTKFGRRCGFNIFKLAT